MEAHWRTMVMKQEAMHIQATKQDADIEVKWHLCPRCEGLETGQTEAQVMEATFKKPMEHKKNRVQRYHQVLEKISQSGRPRTASATCSGAGRRSCSVRTLRRCFPSAKHLP